jgi:hypothetical protein
MTQSRKTTNERFAEILGASRMVRLPGVSAEGPLGLLWLRAAIARDAELLDSLEPPNTWTEAERMAEIERRARRVLENGPRGATWPELRVQIEHELKV